MFAFSVVHRLLLSLRALSPLTTVYYSLFTIPCVFCLTHYKTSALLLVAHVTTAHYSLLFSTFFSVPLSFHLVVLFSHLSLLHSSFFCFLALFSYGERAFPPGEPVLLLLTSITITIISQGNRHDREVLVHPVIVRLLVGLVHLAPAPAFARWHLADSDSH